MKFGNTKGELSAHTPFNWLAEYNDGTYLVEYDKTKEYKKNDFYSIQQDKLSKFGMFGDNMEFYYDEQGRFNVNGKPIEIYFKYDGIEYELTNSKDKDCIQYKQASSIYANRNGKGKETLESLNFGYKCIMDFGELQFYFSPILVLPMKGKVHFEVKLTSNKSINGELIFKTNGQEIDRGLVETEINKRNIIHWIFK